MSEAKGRVFGSKIGKEHMQSTSTLQIKKVNGVQREAAEQRERQIKTINLDCENLERLPPTLQLQN